jgi:hypothetical protein
MGMTASSESSHLDLADRGILKVDLTGVHKGGQSGSVRWYRETWSECMYGADLLADDRRRQYASSRTVYFVSNKLIALQKYLFTPKTG